MAFQYPEQPWVDGQETDKVTLSDGSVAFAIYESSKNLWKHYRLNSDKNIFTVDSCEVYVDHDKCPCEITPDVEYKQLQWQQNINDYFEFWIHAEDAGLVDRVVKLEATTKDLQKQIDRILELIQNIEGVGDLQQLIDEINAIKDILENLDARDVNQAPLPGMTDSAIIASIPPGVVPNTQQWTNYYLTDVIAQGLADNQADHESFREELANLEDNVVNNSGDLTHKLDKRGDTMSGDLMFSGRDNIIVLNDESMRLKSSRDDDPDSTATHITVGRNGDGDPTTNIYHLQRPQQPAWAVNMEYSDEQDQLLQNQIDTGFETQQEILSNVETLQNKVTALEGSIVDASWTFESDDRVPRAGEFALRGGGDAVISNWSAANTILINTVSSAGDTFTFEKVTVNDVIRIGAGDASNAEYRITTILGPGSYTVEHLRSAGVATDEQEYSFTFLSAFDPEGLSTIDYVDAQDALRVAKAGDSMQGPLIFDSSNSTIEIAGDTGSLRRRYLKIRGNNQYEMIVYPGQDNSGSKTAFELKAKTDGNPELKLNYLVDPTQNGHAVNLRYANANYLKLSGGTLTGNLIFKDADGNEKARIQANNGFIRTYDQVRVDRNNFANCFEARRDGSTNATIKSDGSATFKVSVTKDGNELATEALVGTYMPLAGGTFTGNVNLGNKTLTNIAKVEVNLQSGSGNYFIVKGVKDGESSVSDDFFYAYSNGPSQASAMNYKGRIASDNNLVNKKYVDNKFATANAAVEVSNSSLPPAGKAKGTLLLTSSNNFYIYT